jgi:hypothetical protein
MLALEPLVWGALIGLCLGGCSELPSDADQRVRWTPYHVGGGIWLPPERQQFQSVAEGDFATYAEAYAYVRDASRQYPTAQFGLSRIVSYPIWPGGVLIDRPLTEDDTLEWWSNGHVTLRTFPPSRECGDEIAVRAHIVQHRCEGNP